MAKPNYNDLKLDDLLLSRKSLEKTFIERLKTQQPQGNGTSPCCDEVEGPNREVGEITPAKASIWDYLFALGSMGTFVADIVFDVLVARQHFMNGDYEWFGLTLTFIIVPLLMMQIFSCKWFREDYLRQTWWTYLLHVFQLGIIERYCMAFRYGLETRRQEKVNGDDYIRFLKEWRDITLLRLFEGFMEAAPQTVLQLYILTIQNEFIIERDWLTAASAVASVISLSWSIVSYSQMLRICLNDKGLSYCGYSFQILYRLFIVSSRAVVLVLFASAYGGYVFIFIFVHCCVMFAWINIQETVNSLENGKSGNNVCFDKMFDFVVAIIYLYCFMTIQSKTTRNVISIFYTVMLVENVVLMGAWFPQRTLEGALMYASFGVVFGGFIIGIGCMMMYYQYFHPSRDVTEGWFAFCCFRQAEKSDNNESITQRMSFSYPDEDKAMVIINVGDSKYRKFQGSDSNTSPSIQLQPPKKQPVEGMELARPSSPFKNLKHSRTDSEIAASSDNYVPREGYARYGTLESPEKLVSDQKLTVEILDNQGKVISPKQLFPVNAKKQEDRRNKSRSQKNNTLEIKASKTKDLRQWDNHSDLIKNKNEITNIKFGASNAEKNENKRQFNERYPLLSRRGSKDDTCIVRNKTGSMRESFTQRKSLQDKRSVQKDVKDWTYEEDISNSIANNDSSVLSTLV